MQLLPRALRSAGILLLVLGPLPLAAGGRLLRRLGAGAGEARRGGPSQPGAPTVASPSEAEPRENCGPLETYLHARPAHYQDAQKARYDAETKKSVEVTFVAGDMIEFECIPGYSTDGSKDGNRTFGVTCSELGYYKPGGVCLKASLCGPIPHIAHAIPTGKCEGGKVQFSCSSGHSLDGEAVVVGGLGKNQLFELSCIEFSGEYENFKGECKPYAFMPATESVRTYNKVFEALFIVSCKSTLRRAFALGEGPPEGLDAACGELSGGANLQSQCQGLVVQIKSDFEQQQKARQEHNDAAAKEWLTAHDADRPGIGSEAHSFCSKLWGLLSLAPSSL